MKNGNVVKQKKDFSTGLIILIIVLLLIIGLAVFICYGKGGKFSKNEHESREKNSEREKDNIGEIKKLDLSKSLNTDNVFYQNASDSPSGNYGLTMKINPDKKSITLSIDWNIFGPLSGASSWDPTVKDYQITGFTKKVSSTFIGELGQDAKGVTLFYLMADGTVEYTPMFILVQEGQKKPYYNVNYTYDSKDGSVHGDPYFSSNGAVHEATKVIKFYNVDASSGGSGSKTTIGARADGSFYDLGTVLNYTVFLF